MNYAIQFHSKQNRPNNAKRLGSYLNFHISNPEMRRRVLAKSILFLSSLSIARETLFTAARAITDFYANRGGLKISFILTKQKNRRWARTSGRRGYLSIGWLSAFEHFHVPCLVELSLGSSTVTLHDATLTYQMIKVHIFKAHLFLTRLRYQRPAALLGSQQWDLKHGLFSSTALAPPPALLPLTGPPSPVLARDRF
ncbi:hypothetical protein T12_8817 [Trichinella patagoniensis]|uniref:Uncharacterized protein n=1 Tax=Trichinella patagoniensis TaxID=990121 RepID=A0A0V0ZB67_9BILA|nr:hypothetical protein T12_8817 [Trichinella patagoniensis]